MNTNMGISTIGEQWRRLMQARIGIADGLAIGVQVPVKVDSGVGTMTTRAMRGAGEKETDTMGPNGTIVGHLIPTRDLAALGEALCDMVSCYASMLRLNSRCIFTIILSNSSVMHPLACE